MMSNAKMKRSHLSSKSFAKSFNLELHTPARSNGQFLIWRLGISFGVRCLAQGHHICGFRTWGSTAQSLPPPFLRIGRESNRPPRSPVQLTDWYTINGHPTQSSLGIKPATSQQQQFWIRSRMPSRHVNRNALQAPSQLTWGFLKCLEEGLLMFYVCS